jgi:hypothetical protein
LEHFAFETAIVVLPVQREELRQAQLGHLLDPAVQLDEWNTEPPGKPPADSRLARAPQAEQRDDALRRRIRVRQQGGRCRVERPRDVREATDRDVAAAGLELREVALRDAGSAGERTARDAALVAPRAHALSKAAEVERFLRFAGEGRVHEI